GGFKEHLVEQSKLSAVSFELPEKLKHRYEQMHEWWQLQLQQLQSPPRPGEPPPPMPPPSEVKYPCGAIVGNLLACFRRKDPPEGEPREVYLFRPGEEIRLFTVGGGHGDGPKSLAPVYDTFVVVDFFKSEMSEYDSNFVYVPLDYLQRLRTAQNSATHIL